MPPSSNSSAGTMSVSMSIPTEPQIPFGYRRVHGQSQKGDGIWNGRRFVKVKPVWPDIKVDDVVIRRCEVVQPELVSEVDVSGIEVMEM